MIIYRSNPKRALLKKAVALMAIALVLGASLQQVHAFCPWNEASPANNLAATAVNEASPSAKSQCCCQSHHANKATTCGLAIPPDQTSSPIHPCDDADCQHCWCCQTALPQVVTTNTTALLKFSGFLTTHSTVAPLTLPVASTLTAGTISDRGKISLSALERCSQLCRFLA
jgi:hypothetical protein